MTDGGDASVGTHGVERTIPAARASAADRASLWARYWPELSIACIGLVLYALLRNIAVPHDVVWQMWIARQMLGGAKLFTDILELNPPLWFWLAVPIQQIAEFTAITSVQAIVAAHFALIGCALALLAALLNHQHAWTRFILLFAALLALVIVPISDFAQREHLSLIVALPYAALLARRAEGGAVPLFVAAAVGLLAAMGFALKHYFVVIPLLLEGYLFWSARARWKPLRPETIALGACAVTYAAAMVILTPDFFSFMVPIIRLAYDGSDVSLGALFINFHTAVWFLMTYLLWKMRAELSPLSIAAALTGLGFAISYAAQHKGWDYHALPVTGALFFAIAALIPAYRWATTPRLSTVVFAVTMVLPLYAAASLGAYANPRAPFVNQLLAQAKPGQTAVMLTGSPSNIWPMVEEAGLRWPPRYYTFWMLYRMHAYRQTHGGALSPELAAFADTVRQHTVEDLSCNPPDIILVDDFSASTGPGFDVLAFFQESADFRALISHYVQGPKAAVYTAYARQPGWSPARPSRCRAIR